MSPYYWKDSAVNLFPRGPFQDTSRFVLKVNGQGPFCFPKPLLKFHILGVCFKFHCKKVR